MFSHLHILHSGLLLVTVGLSLCSHAQPAPVVVPMRQYRGNTLHFCRRAHTEVHDLNEAATGKNIGNITNNGPIPCKLNSRPIYMMTEVTIQPRPAVNSQPLVEYLYEHMLPHTEFLPNGEYELNMLDVVIDSSGSVAYFDFAGLHSLFYSHREHRFGDTVQSDSFITIVDSIEEHATDIWLIADSILHNMPRMSPAVMGDKAVAVLCPNEFFRYEIVVADHVATLRRRYK